MQESLSTIGDIARRVGVPVHRVQYVIRSRAIAHLRKVGNLRVFDEEHVQFIEQELERAHAYRGQP